MCVRATVPAACAVLLVATLGCDGSIDGGPAGRKGNDPGDGPTVRLVDGGGDPDVDAGPSDMVRPVPPGTDAGLGGGGGGGGGTTESTCEELGYLGAGDGDVARWCDDGEMKERDCAAEGLRCRWIDNSTGYYCGEGGGGGGGGGDGTIDAGSGGGGTVPSGCASAVEAEELELTNAARREAGLSPLECDEDMARAARLHSQDMCDQGYFSHTSRDGRSFTDRLDAQGVSYRTAGENIAWGQRTPDDVHRAWMGSSGHRANILGSQYGRIGIGHVDCGGSPYWTQTFAD